MRDCALIPYLISSVARGCRKRSLISKGYWSWSSVEATKPGCRGMLLRGLRYSSCLVLSRAPETESLTPAMRHTPLCHSSFSVDFSVTRKRQDYELERTRDEAINQLPPRPVDSSRGGCPLRSGTGRDSNGARTTRPALAHSDDHGHSHVLCVCFDTLRLAECGGSTCAQQGIVVAGGIVRLDEWATR